MAREIKVVIDEGRMFQGLYVTPELADCEVELIDFVTDDLDEIEETQIRYNECLARAQNGELKGIGS